MRQNLKNFPKVDISEIERDLNTEYAALKPGYDTAKKRRMDWWREYAFQLYGNEKKGQSKLVDSTIFDAIEWYIPTLIQPFFETQTFLDITPDGADARSIVMAEALRELLNYQMRKKNKWYTTVYDTIKGFLVQGESYIKLTWQGKDPSIGENSPYAKVTAIPAEQIRYDWTVQDFCDSSVVTQEEDMTKSEVLKMMSGAKGLIEDRFDEVMASNGTAIGKAELRDERQNQPNWVGNKEQTTKRTDGLFTRREQWTSYSLDGGDIEEPIMAVFINDTLVQVIKNPYRFKAHPFVSAECIRDPLGNPAISIPSILSDVQKFRTGILRMVSDNLNSQNNGLVEVDRNNIDQAGMMLLRNAPTGTKVPIPVRKMGSINPISPTPIANHAFTAWELSANMGENRSGNTRYTQGLDSRSLNQTATGITNIMQRSDMRAWELAQRFAEYTLVPLTRKIISLNQQKLPKQAIQAQFGIQSMELLGGKAVSAGEWFTIGKDDLGGYFNVNIDINVGSDRQQKIDNYLQYAQFFAPFIGSEGQQGAIPAEVMQVVAVETAKEMGLSKVQSVMRENYVGTRGASIPKSIFGDVGSPVDGDPTESQGLGLEDAEADVGSDLQGLDIAGVLGGLGGDGEVDTGGGIEGDGFQGSTGDLPIEAEV